MAAEPHPDGLEHFDFDGGATYWDSLYDAASFASVAYYQARFERTLAWIDALALPPDARVLEIGFGAGRTAIALAERGLRVTGIDTGERMLELARRRAARSGLGGRIDLSLGDAHEIAQPDASFDLVLALGVVPWLERPARGVREMARVTRPRGWVIASANNRRQLNRVLDPRLNPAVEPIKQFALRAARRSGRDLRAGVHAPRQDPRRRFERWLRAAGLEPVQHATLGFGNFSLLGRSLVSDATAIRIHDRLQRRADAGFPVLRSSGAQLLVLSRKR